MPAEQGHAGGEQKDLTGARERDTARERLDGLWPLAFDELKRVAHRRLAAERDGHTLGTTALVHETYLRLAGQHHVSWADRGEFFGQAGRAMRRILVDYARRHRALRRGGGAAVMSLDMNDSLTGNARHAHRFAIAERADAIVALDEALGRFAALEPRATRVVECRFFAGLTEEETAVALGVTPRTVARDWVKARAWLHRALTEPADHAT